MFTANEREKRAAFIYERFPDPFGDTENEESALRAEILDCLDHGGSARMMGKIEGLCFVERRKLEECDEEARRIISSRTS
jgi:hypothetical protein